MTTIAANLQAIQHNIEKTAQACRRNPEDIRLLAVSKTFDQQSVRHAWAAGQRRFAENYLQEALEKINALQDLAIEWHFIGPIQSNKTRAIAENFAWVHSVERLKIAQRLSDQRPDTLPPLQICLQINISGEDSKSGIPPEQCAELAAQVQSLPRLKLRGLMTVPARHVMVEQQQRSFQQLRQLLEQLNQQGMQLDTLSMGMSQDYPVAIAEGATLIRIGSALFGQRHNSK